MSPNSNLTTFFIDLDDTVYPASAGVWPLIQQRIYAYMQEVLGIPQEEVSPLRERLFRAYGTTLRGLQIERGADMNDYLSYVHNLNLEGYLKPSPELCAALDTYPQSKWVFTNASRAHAQNVLNVMGLAGSFNGVIDVTDMEPFCKPDREAYLVALHLAGNPSPQQCLLVDDRRQNLAAARNLGFQVILISDKPEPGYTTIQKLADLPKVLPW